eukprot:TRINITY_DN19874_c0_g1_i10.p1 TRINITY_DN19874_c0_g1~~TRINITY_DN19874_c0_g1_i10.p1  ORF type:complete len:232 (-),score=36.08 TRINITY_DN19874_c0_g1_i10:221-916(-)
MAMRTTTLVLTLTLAYAATPPTWPNQFHVEYTEYSHQLHPWGNGTTNQGSLHYDFTNRRQLFVHGEGQTDNWCQCAGTGTDDECHLLSAVGASGNSSEGSMIAWFPALAKCCTIGNWDHGFGPIRPDWLVAGNSTHVGPKKVDGRMCDEWANNHPGDYFMMTSDNWSQDSNGVPCDYVDTFKKWVRVLGMRHSLTFDPSSYSTAAEGDAVFARPTVDCSESCPNKQGWCTA